MSDSVRENVNLGSYEQPVPEQQYYETHGSYPSGEYEGSDILTDEDLLDIQMEYRRKRLIESLIGPIASTVFHLILIIILAIMITGKVKEPVAEIEVTIEQIEEVKLEEPPPIEIPDPVEEPTETTNPVLTTVAVENNETNDAALENTDDNAPSTDDNMTEMAVSDVTVSPSAFASPSVYGGRSASGRAGAVTKFGGTEVGQQALLKALWWLAKVQNPDGSWGNKQKESMTGLAILTFLAHGETTTSKHFGTNVKKGVQWLVNTVNKKHNSIQGSKNNGGNSRNVYSHALLTYALSEATAMIGASTIEDSHE